MSVWPFVLYVIYMFLALCYAWTRDWVEALHERHRNMVKEIDELRYNAASALATSEQQANQRMSSIDILLMSTRVDLNDLRVPMLILMADAIDPLPTSRIKRHPNDSACRYHRIFGYCQDQDKYNIQPPNF